MAQKTEAGFDVMMIVYLTVAIIILGVISQIGVYTLEKVSDKTALTDDVADSGTITFTALSNVSNGELINFTKGTAVYRFEFNTTGNPQTTEVQTANAIRVNASGLAGQSWNGGWKVSGNLTTAINNNATLAALITATNVSNGVTILGDTAGVSSDITLADNGVNITVSGLSGFIKEDTFYAASDDAVSAVETGFDFQEILILAIIASAIIGLFIGLVSLRK